MRRFGLLVVLLVAVVAAGCGDDEPTPVAGGDDCTTVTVEIGDFDYAPTPVEIEACDSVVWTNAHDQAHTATASSDDEWTTGNLQPGESSEPVAFDEPGEHPYLCALHPFMQGVVAVT